jgi:hypothetical protein
MPALNISNHANPSSKHPSRCSAHLGAKNVGEGLPRELGLPLRDLALLDLALHLALLHDAVLEGHRAMPRQEATLASDIGSAGGLGSGPSRNDLGEGEKTKTKKRIVLPWEAIAGRSIAASAPSVGT